MKIIFISAYFTIKILVLLFLMVSFLGCNYSQPAHIQAADIVMNKFEKKLKQNKIIVFGVGGKMMNNVKEFKYDLDYCANLELDEARKLIVETIEDLILETNNDKNIRQYLEYFPYSEKHLYLAIGFVKSTKMSEDVDPPFISFVQNRRGEDLRYFRKDGTDKPFYTEPYAEAYEKVYGVPLPDRMSQIRDLDKECK